MTDRWLGLMALAIGVVILFVWIPLDVDSGIIEKARRSTVLGDSFAPAVAAALVAMGGCLLLFERRGRDTADLQEPSQLPIAPTHSPPFVYVQLANLHYLAITLLLLTIAIATMRYTGPLAVALIGEDGSSYRLLRDTPPWKYVGFTSGGVLLVTGLITWVERRFRFRFLLIGLAAVLVLIAIYDLPFDDLLLPPNGDV